MLKDEDFFIKDFFEVADKLNLSYSEADAVEELYLCIFEKYFRDKLDSENSELWMNLKSNILGAHLPMGASQFAYSYINLPVIPIPSRPL